MSGSRPVSESQSGSTPKRPASIADGDVETYRNPRKKLTRMVSDGRLAMAYDFRQPESSVDATPGLRRAASSNNIPTLQRQMSSSTLLKAEVLKTNLNGRNKNMVLQLVLPSANGEGNFGMNSIDEIMENRRRRSIGSQQEAYSTAGTELYTNLNNDLTDYSRNYPPETPTTPFSTSSSPDHSKSTDLKTKKQHFRKQLGNILSSMYAIFIVTLGLVVYLSDALMNTTPLAESFSLYLVSVAFIFILYLTIDIKVFVTKRNRYNDLLEKNIPKEIEVKESANGDFHFNISLPEAARAMKELEHRYCFSKDRHSGNFYLKVGAGVFCLGHLIHSGLLIGYQIMLVTSDKNSFYECANAASLSLDIIYPVYSFLLLYFIFKYSNIIVNCHRTVVRFGIMHCLSSSLCFWFWTIQREIMGSLAHHHADAHGEVIIESLSDLSPTPLLPRNENISKYQFIGECINDETLTLIYRDYSPYFFPFSVEYSILVVGVLFVIWENIGKCKECGEEMSLEQCESPVGNGDNLQSNVVVHADCHSANKGLFGGIMIMVLTVVSIILFLIASNDERYKTEAVIINAITSIIIVAFMLIACLFLYRQLTKLDLSTEHISILDDFFLYICIPAFFLHAIINIVPSAINGHVTGMTSVIVETAQILVQTPLIMDGIRRCSNSKELRKEKPGRELLTFLIVCNISAWVLQTFQVKSHEMVDSKTDFYGQETWSIVGHACVPLVMFYRFHSSVCLADIWQYAYQSERH